MNEKTSRGSRPEISTFNVNIGRMMESLLSPNLSSSRKRGEWFCLRKHTYC